MNKFLEETWKFNDYGGTPIDDSYENLEAAYNLIASELQELRDNLDQYKLASKIKNGKRKEELKAKMLDDITDIDVTAAGFIYRMGAPRTVLECAQYVVCEANMSKFPETLEEAEQSVVQYESDDRYENVKFEQVAGDGVSDTNEERYVVFGNPKGTDDYKILKSIGFTDPQKKLNDLMKIK